jgi:inorganic triphosphatase YgiF
LRVQTIKAARASEGIALARSEWEHEIKSDSPDYTILKKSALKPLLKNSASVQPVFRVITHRTLRNVLFGSSTIEIAADRGKVEANEQTTHFDELELELKDGAAADLFRLALVLSTATPLRLSFKTKADRGFEAASGVLPKRVKASAVVLKRKTSSAAAFQLIGASCLQHLMANEAIVRRTREADAVHQMRVALRRLRAALTLFKGVITDEKRDPIKAELKWMANVLGEARDLDVYIFKVLEPAQDAHGNDESYQDLLAEYRQRRERAYQVVHETITSRRFINGILETAAWIETGDWLLDESKSACKRRGNPVSALAEQELGRRRKKILKRGRKLGELDSEKRHQVRIEIKKFRYAAEFFQSLFKGGRTKKRTRATLTVLEALQESLGELNDIAVGSHLNWSSAADAIHQEQISRVDSLLAGAKAHYQELATLEPFWQV